METPQVQTSTPPAMDVVAPPPPEQTGETPATVAKSEAAASKTKATVEKSQPKGQNQNNSVTLAIVATLMIVFGLSALAVFAYLRSN